MSSCASSTIRESQLWNSNNWNPMQCHRSAKLLRGETVHSKSQLCSYFSSENEHWLWARENRTYPLVFGGFSSMNIASVLHEKCSTPQLLSIGIWNCQSEFNATKYKRNSWFDSVLILIHIVASRAIRNDGDLRKNTLESLLRNDRLSVCKTGYW